MPHTPPVEPPAADAESELQTVHMAADLAGKRIAIVLPHFLDATSTRELLVAIESTLRPTDTAAKESPAEPVHTVAYDLLPVSERLDAGVLLEQPDLLPLLNSRDLLGGAESVLMARQQQVSGSDVRLTLVLYDLSAETLQQAKAPEQNEKAPEPADADPSTETAPKPAAPQGNAEIRGPIDNPKNYERRAPCAVWSSTLSLRLSQVSTVEPKTDSAAVLRRALVLFDEQADLLLAAKALVGRKAADEDDYLFAAASLVRDDLDRTWAQEILREAYGRRMLNGRAIRLLIALSCGRDRQRLQNELDPGRMDTALDQFLGTGNLEAEEKLLKKWVKEFLDKSIHQGS